MAKVAREQEELESRVAESEEKRKRTKRTLREVLEGGSASGYVSAQARSRRNTQTALKQDDLKKAVEHIPVGKDGRAVEESTAALGDNLQVRTPVVQLPPEELSDDDSDMEEEFFDAVDAGEVEVMREMPGMSSPPATPAVSASIDGVAREEANQDGQLVTGGKNTEIQKSYKGYEDGLRKKLDLDADNRPKVSLWVSILHYPLCSCHHD